MKEIARYDELKVPSYALPYLVNDDPSGLEDDEIKTIDAWFAQFAQEAKKENAHVIFSTAETSFEEYFSPSPEFGLPANVVDCIVLIVS